MAGVLGLVLGWAVRPICLRLGYAEPDVPLLTIGLLFFAAAIIGGTAYVTRRTVQRNRFDLAHHQAVNRLVARQGLRARRRLPRSAATSATPLAQLGVGDPAADHQAVALLPGRPRRRSR